MNLIKKINSLLCTLLATLAVVNIAHASSEGELSPGMVNPGHAEQPDWFKVSFLDLFDDIQEAAEKDKRLMVYYFQDGCPYCKILLEDNFSQREIAEKTKQYFDVVSINLWGDKDVTVGDKIYTEKEFAEALKVQYTPTLLFFNEDNKIIFRANGYYPPEKFSALLDYIGQKKENDISYQDYMTKVDPKPSSGKLHNDINSVKTASDVSQYIKDKSDKPLLVFFEQKKCSTCDELHLDILSREESIEALSRFNVVVLDMWSNDSVITPAGMETNVRAWVKQLDVKYAPSLVFFDNLGDEVFRTDAYLKAFHTQTAMEYVSSGAYQKQKNFQRYVDARADSLREQGIEVDLMK